MADILGKDLGRYRIIEKLGEGGMATVYKAYDTRLERDVAVKIIRKDVFPPAQLDLILKRFEREAKALAKLSHPNIVNVLDYGEFEGSPFLVMVYLPSGTLKQILGKPIPWQEAATILLPISHALQFAHKQGIIHRDIKPSNILLTLSGEPILTDFGIAKLLESGEATSLTGTGLGVGTPEYMAPEQWTGQGTSQSDLYSLGVVFYEMITGRKPYIADTPAAILLKQNSESLPRPKSFAPGLPKYVEKVIFKALARNQENRFQDMEAFSFALENILKGTSHISRFSTEHKNIPTVNKSVVYTNTSSDKVMGQSTILQSISRVPDSELQAVQAGLSNEKLETIIEEYFDGDSIASPKEGKIRRTKRLTCVTVATAIIAILFIGIISTPLAAYFGLLSSASSPNDYFRPLELLTFSTPSSTIIPTKTEIPLGVADHRRPVITEYNSNSFYKIISWETPYEIASIAFSPDGSLMAAGYALPQSGDPSTIIINTSDGSHLYSLYGQLRGVTCVKFSPNGSVLATGGDGADIKLWHVADGSLLFTLYPGAKIHSMVFSADGKELATGLENGSIQMWRVSDGVPLMNLPAPRANTVPSLSFSSDGSMLAAAYAPFPDKSPVRIWRVPSYFQFLGLPYSENKVSSSNYVSFSPDGSKLATYINTSEGGGMKIWGIPDGTLLSSFDISGIFSPNWSIIVSDAIDQDVYSARDGHFIHRIRTLCSGRRIRVFSADSHLFAFGCNKTISIWGVS